MKSAKRKQLEARAAEALVVKTPLAERLLIEELPHLTATRILCTTLGRGQFAQTAAEFAPAIPVTCHCLDLWDAQVAREHCGTGEGKPEIVCTADFPEQTVDLVAVPVDPRGEMELTRDLLQQGYDRLVDGGRMLTATSNPEDQWLHSEMHKLFDKVTRRPQPTGVVYSAVKTGPLKKHKNFDCQFAFRDQGRLIHAVSRPGVFSHRSLDGGARALMNTMEVPDGARVLDLGCGAGTVALAAALRGPRVEVVAVDSHARAVQCVLKGAELNALEHLTAVQDADGEVPGSGTFDLVLGNPPYYSDYRIAEIFLQGARRALKPGGRVLIVAKSYAWYETRMPELFADVTTITHKQYTVVSGIQPG